MVKQSTITTTPYEAGFAASVRGVDLTASLTPAEVTEIKAAWVRYPVLAFPDQKMNHDALEAFTCIFGTFGEDPYIEPLPDHPHILELRREANETASNFGSGWHSDWSFQESPPAGTILHSKVIPPVGGDTLFANGYGAWEDLAPDLKTRVQKLRGIHSAILPYSKEGFYAQDESERAMKFKLDDSARASRTHPIARRHPKSGQIALFVNPVYTIGIDGIDKDEATELLAELCAHSVQDKYVYRHKWESNMILMWDNRCLQHFADGGYDGHLRVMHRTTIAGEPPLE